MLAGYLLWVFYASFMKTKQMELETWTSALSESVADALVTNDLVQVDRLVKRYGAPESVTLRVFDPKGRLLSSSAPQIDRQVTDWLAIPGMQEAVQTQIVQQGLAKGVFSNEDRLYTARPIYRDSQVLGILRMSITITQFQRQFRWVIFTVLGTLIVTFLLCAFISIWLARSIAEPIQGMCRFAIRLGNGYFGEKLTLASNDELGQLAFELNRMSERLASLDNERRAFLANVSHELRTPISNVKVTLEALEHGADRDPDLRSRFIQTAMDETIRLSRLIQDLLDLGRLEAGVVQLERQEINLKNAIARAVQAIELRVRSKGVTLAQDVPSVVIAGDPERLLQAFLNLLDNAIKYSLPDSVVSLVGVVKGNIVAIQITDQGTGISNSDLPHIFEEFYTADSSRQKGGTGLGLPIARRIVEAHGGSITAHSIDGQGATFTIYLPVSAEH